MKVNYQELRQLCERVFTQDCPASSYVLVQDLAQSCLRLVAENEQLKQEVDRMREVVKAAEEGVDYIDNALFARQLRQALSKLGDT